jgi:hypothetical protein
VIIEFIAVNATSRERLATLYRAHPLIVLIYIVPDGCEVISLTLRPSVTTGRFLDSLRD